MTDIPSFVLVGTSKATTYRFQVQQPLGGWALCTVNDSTGELSIQSDWENWAHRWNPVYLGAPSLTHFIAKGSCQYLADKLANTRPQRQQFDPKATVRAFRQRLALTRLGEGRDAGKLSARGAREIWNDLLELKDCDSPELFVERFFNIDGHGWVSEAPWEHLVYTESYIYQVLLQGILPALVAVCRAVPTA
jgi:hypothetical protein